MQLEPENRILEDPGTGAGGLPEEGTRVIAGPGAGLRGMMLVTAGIVAGDWALLYHEPGAGVGVFFLVLLGLVWMRPGRRATGSLPLILTGLYMASALQSVVFTSFSNLVVLVCLLLMLSGDWGTCGWEARWARWLEGGLSLLRPMGALLQAKAILSEEAGERPGLLGQGFQIAAPAAVLLMVFVPLLSGGNAVFGLWVEALLRNLEFPHIGDLICWGMLGSLGLIIVFPGQRTTLAGRLAGQWPLHGTRTPALRLMQWLAILMALNLLFLFSNVLDVAYLWFSRELPEGVTYSRYVHHGVYALITTTVLSALILGLLTQHTDAIRRNAPVRALALLWMLQNLLLISGVFLRLSLYVNAYGYTPKRVYVALFLALVVAGFASLAWALLCRHNLKWLSGVNLSLVFLLFTVIQFIDVPGIVARKNMTLYGDGKIACPDADFLRQIGSHSVPFMLHVREHGQTPADAEYATQWLAGSVHCYPFDEMESGWQSFQLRDERNRRKFAAYRDRLNLSKTP